MSLGMDLYARYQTVTDWRAVRDARIRVTPQRAPQPIEWAYVKLTDGGGPATVRGDSFVHGLRSIDLPIGGYHFPHPGDPARQAEVFMDEADRLDVYDLPPMLDLEDQAGVANIPAYAKREWAERFVNRLHDGGVDQAALYMSGSDAAALRPDTWNLGNTLLWIASYGPNNGYRNALTGGYTGRLDIHQYTSTGRVPGISGNVDLNEAMIDMTGDDQVSKQDVQDALNDPNWRPIGGPDGASRTPVEHDAQMEQWMAELHAMVRRMNEDLGDDELKILTALTQGKGEILAAVAAIPPGGTPTPEQMDALLSALLTALPAANAAELGRRLSAAQPAE